MSRGVLLIASNNEQIDYIKQAVFCAKQIKAHLGLDVCLATDNVKYLETAYPFYKSYIDQIVELEYYNTSQIKTYHDGIYAQKKLPWKNHYRVKCYNLTPYEETIVMDTDFIVNNDVLLNCFDYNEDFLIYKSYKDLNPNRVEHSFEKVSDRSIDMVWATVFYFKKSKLSEFYFDLVNHIYDNWSYYRLIYQIPNVNFRNDYAFSIAIHILNGFQRADWPKNLPGNFWTTTDADILYEYKDTSMKFLLENTQDRGQFYAGKILDGNVHVMNKFSLNRIIDEVLVNE